jgi:hypothetical protein
MYTIQIVKENTRMNANDNYMRKKDYSDRMHRKYTSINKGMNWRLN